MSSIVAETALTEPVKVKGKVFFPNLDGLRFIAFFLVYLQHGFNGAASGLLDHHGKLLERLREAVFTSGWTGVSFFFVLSGFLITYLILTEIKVTGRINVIDFYIRRMLRIWPLYYLILAFGFWLYPSAKQLLGYSPYIETGNPFYYLFFLSNFDVISLGGHGAMSTNITWSVAIEEQFYLVWPLLFFFLRPNLYKYLFVLIIISSTIFRWTHLNDSLVLYFHSLSVISDMAVGGLAAYLVIHSEQFRLFFEQAPRSLISAAYLAGGLIVVFRYELFQSVLPEALERLVLSLFFAFVLLEQNYSRHSLFKMSDRKWISSLGRYTYGLYLLHPVALLILLGVFQILGVAEGRIDVKISVGMIGLAVSVALSYISYHVVEKHFLRLKGRFTHVASSSSVTLTMTT